MNTLIPLLKSGMLKSPGDVLSSKAFRDLNLGRESAGAVDSHGCAVYEIQDISPVLLNQHAPHEPDHEVYDHAATLLQLYGVAVVDQFFGSTVSDEVASGAKVLHQRCMASAKTTFLHGMWYHAVEDDWANHEHPHVHSILDHQLTWKYCSIS